jgi:hypothetical protein
MAANKTINVDSLKRVSTDFDPVLRFLPYRNLQQRIAEMNIRFLSSDKEMEEIQYQRNGRISKPYTPGQTPDADANLGKIRQAKLKPDWGYTSLVENIMNYEAVNVVGNTPEHVDPETKRHPLEFLILQGVMQTVSEDILDALHFAKRDPDDKSPLGLFDGYNEYIDQLIAAGEVSQAKGNLIPTGAITAPVNDYAVYTTVVNWLRASNWNLKKSSILKITQTVYFHLLDALGIKLKYTGQVTMDMLLQALKTDAGIGNLQLSVELEMGTGDRMILTTADNLDFSLWTNTATQFVQVRNPFIDPNDVQYWCQWKAGVRVRAVHPKNFQINDGTPIGNQLSGDYFDIS